MNNKILVIDDDIDLCRLLKNNLETEGYMVTVCHDGESGTLEAVRNSYHMIVLDIMLPKKSGFDVLSDIRKTSHVPILMLTAKNSEVDKVSGLRMGADDYLTKPFSSYEFSARVASLLRRYTVFNSNSEYSEQAIDIGNLHIDPSTHKVRLNGTGVDLTAKEFDLMYFLVKNRGKVFTKKQIYSAVWEDEYVFDDNNIMALIHRLRKKIGDDSETAQYIQTVWGIGYRFSGEEE
ncbi:DNA-binding response regulator, OmpR family, contains REC and winged-helix (wHTH) domain [Clostridium cavendishii DSM 21758]|uniref:Stage 0 sporulation protein A homolog n=1 Tax=Clostridium cavendishii DSM 21758 TaxID=1121302 RepID=A0A1M6MKC9_9CLOT|nr:response regulator transcription factor [Clostridium cavendishii]SHJ83733.1 DNA-binding response regulator, OmpR family, contains REC and winged-helix (wHTH) domain [Clostridium cavendishii DSM 21758]